MGNTVGAWLRLGAMTGTMSAGRTSPSVTIGLHMADEIVSVSGERFAAST
jgi:hypothetical protein